MSDEDRDVDVESDIYCLSQQSIRDRYRRFKIYYFKKLRKKKAEKRAHHNALERKRRDHIKESFHSLRDSVPTLQVEKVTVSRAQILKKAADYIQFMRTKNQGHQKDIDDLKKQNNYLEKQIRALEKAKSTGSYTNLHSMGASTPNVQDYTNDSESESDEIDNSNHGRRKRLKTTN